MKPGVQEGGKIVLFKLMLRRSCDRLPFNPQEELEQGFAARQLEIQVKVSSIIGVGMWATYIFPIQLMLLMF